MNTKQLQYVKVLARVGSFSGAAEELGISQPSLSQYVKKIEHELGMELFCRAGNTLRLTDAGEVYLDTGRKMLDLEAQMTARLADIRGNRRGVLRIGAAPFRTSSLLPRAIAAFRERYPGITVRVFEQTTAELKTCAARGDFDLCLCTLPVDEKLFVSEKVTAEELAVAVPAAFPVNERLRALGESAVPFAAFGEIPFVSVGDDQVLGERLASIAAGAGVTLRKAAVCVNVDSCLAMAEAGIGAALLPRYLTESRSSLVTYPIAGDDGIAAGNDTRDVVVFYRRGTYVSQPMQTMIELLKSVTGSAQNAADDVADRTPEGTV